jgi:protein-S-isoprenylcysteine O-methyltransferase Ste14
MKFRKSWRIPLGFLAGVLFIWRADPSAVWFLTGAVLMVLGEAIRFISAGTLVKFEGVTDTGIYAYTRNPLYIGSFLIGLGACAMGHDRTFMLLFLLLYPLYYAGVIRREERFLIKRYGADYQRYTETVPRLLPRRFGLSHILEHSAPFLSVKNRELKTVVGIAVIWAVMAVKLAA